MEMETREDTFDYAAAAEELQRLAEKVENPATPLEEIDSGMKRAATLIAGCRDYLRGVRRKAEDLGA